MNRVDAVKTYFDSIINNMSDIAKQKNAISHSYIVAQYSAFLAARRGINTELMYICGLLHDVYAYCSGSYDEHDKLGAKMVKSALLEMNLFTIEELITIETAIYHHDEKEQIDSDYDEVLKDADVLVVLLDNGILSVPDWYKKRADKLIAELGL